MIVKNLLDVFEKHGFKWNGVNYTCGFYRVRKLNGTYYLEKFIGYKYRRAEYDNIAYFYCNNLTNSWFDYEVNEQDFNVFKKEMTNAVRDTKLKRIQSYFKHDESHYSHLHANN